MMHCTVVETAYLDNVAHKIRKHLVLFDLLSIVADLLLHDALLVL